MLSFLASLRLIISESSFSAFKSTSRFETYGFKSSSRLSYAFLASFILTPLSAVTSPMSLIFFDNLVYIVGIKSLLPIKDRIAAVYKRIFVLFEFFRREARGIREIS